MPRHSRLIASVAFGTLLLPAAAWGAPGRSAQPQLAHHAHSVRQHGKHVLLISVDGLHASDLSRFVGAHRDSALATLAEQGTTYANAQTSFPSDSFPGLLSLVTGGTPRSTGVYYDNSYDRSLYAPGSTCTGSPGTAVVYDESIDRNPTALDGGGGIDPAKLPRAKTAQGCVPVYPHTFLRVNTIFNVARRAGLRTAWSDKHPAYDILNGPAGHGVEDLYTPEIAASIGGVPINSTVGTTERYDSMKVRAVLNEIDGRTSSGARRAATPAIYGMNFQTVSVAEKLPFNGSLDIGGYFPGGEDFTPQMDGAMAYIDTQMRRLLGELQRRGMLSSTQIVLTAKHGQAPQDPSEHVRVDPGVVPGIATAAGAQVAHDTQDDVALLWLTDQSKTDAAAAALVADQQGDNRAHIDNVLADSDLSSVFGDPRTDPRVPDIVVQPQQGVIYSNSTKKVAEHGGGAPDDRNVALLIADGLRLQRNPGIYGQAGGAENATVDTPVETTQVAPTILDYLRLDPGALQAVHKEGTQALPAS